MYNSDDASIFCSKRPIIYKSFTIKNFEQKVSPIGESEFPFEFRTPEMLPTSTIFASDMFNSCFNIRYGIFAQFVPTSAKDFIDRKKTISIFRGSKDIYLYRAPI